MSTTPNQGQTDDERRSPAAWTLITLWLMPARTARRTAHVSLKSAYLIHLLAAVLALVLIVVLSTWEDAHGQLTFETLVNLITFNIDRLAMEFEQAGRVFVLVVLSVALAVELGFLALASFIMPWGAGDEPVRTSFRHALRRTWLHTTHALPLILLIGISVIALEQASTAWYTANPRPTWPTPPANATPGSQAQQEYQKAMREAQKHYRKYRETIPWHIEFKEFIISDVVLVGLGWFLWALLRAAGVTRSIPPIARPPTCEACGYNLTTIPMDSRCPECGEPVILSLGPNVRPGTAWEHARGAQRPVAWWRCSVDAVRHPAKLGRQLRVAPRRANHRRLWLIHLPMVFFLAPLSLLAAISMTAGLPAVDEMVVVMATVLPTVGFLVTVSLLFVGTSTAAVVGISVGHAHKRNLLPYSMQMASYLSGYFVLWVLFAGLLGVAVTLLSEYRLFRALEQLVGIDDDILAFFAWFLPNVAWGIWYFVLVSRGTAAARYANR